MRLRYLILKILGHRNFKRFIVLSRSRTGSNMLISYLNSHPNIVAKGEALKRMNRKSASDILKEIYSNQPFWKKAVGFKIFYYHPLRDISNNIWNDDRTIQKSLDNI